MRITHRSPDRIELSGIPGGSAAIVVPIGLALVGGLAILFSYATRTVVPLAVGGVLLLLAGAAGGIAWTARESLTLDLADRRGRYLRRSILSSERADLGFDLASIHSVSIERGSVRTPGRRGVASTEVWHARLRLTSPRRALVLAETQGGREHSIRTLAEAVAVALGLPLVDETGDTPEVRRGRAIGAPLAATRELTRNSFGPQPPGSRARLDISPEQETVTLEWKTVGGPALPVLGLLAIGFFALIATAMMLQALSIPVLSWIFGSTGVRKAVPAAPAITCALIAMAATTWLAWLIILELWLVSHRRLTITPERTIYSRLSPSARIFGLVGLPAARWSVATSDVRSIRTHDDGLELRTSDTTHRALIHLPAEGEVAWVAKAARTAVAALGSVDEGSS